MATLIKHGNQYCSKIQKWNGIRQESTKIPLRTNKKDVAVIRHHKVEKSEQHIKDGIIIKSQFKSYFEWLNDDGTSKLVEQTLGDAIILFIKAHKVNVSKGSIERIDVSMNCVKNVWNKNIPIKRIKSNHIEEFKRTYKNKHSVGGINLNLRNIKTFLRYCVDEKMLKHMPKIKMLKEPKRLPKYLSEDNLKTLLNADCLSEQMKRAFYLYLTTGCRRSEIIEGQLNGNILIVPATLSKSRIERRITLDNTQTKIVKEIHIQRDTYLLKGYILNSFKERYTKAFFEVQDRVGFKGYTLHCLRHTYAVTQWIVSNDIYEVKNKLGHTSVTTTEKYARFNLDELAQDFPSAYQVRLEVDKVRKNAIDTPLSDTPFNQIKDSSSIDRAKA